MERLKLAGLGERLKTGGAQMSRKVSGKMKEILQGQTPEGKMVDEATSDRLEEPNWSINLRICGLLNGEELSGSEVVRAIKKKIASNNTVSQRLSLDLLETCAMNCDKVFSEMSSEKVLDEMVRMIDNPQTHYSNRQRALQLIQAWGESSDELGYLPVFHQTYLSLKARGLPFSAQDDENLAPAYFAMEPGVDQQPASLLERYPSFKMNQHAADQNAFASHGGILPVEERKEILIVTRNSIDLLSTMLNSETQQNPTENDDLVSCMIEKCKQSQPIIQRIIESAGDDEEILFEALNLHEELEGVLSKYVERDGLVRPEVLLPEPSKTSSGSSSHVEAKTKTETETETETETDKEAKKLNHPAREESNGLLEGKSIE
eukprot:TRINITY_DN26826_c0_g1_i1.p1 TRINITY_DN26826_c0_g1~~TRINITY_DN26826_c0_g1_i1.p1  ORF type:complete len:376 (-),score=87.15 TRINITY_DN26826_c0_g1_i1:77-1204(-)